MVIIGRQELCRSLRNIVTGYNNEFCTGVWPQPVTANIYCHKKALRASSDSETK
jgi:hypothetical protein